MTAETPQPVTCYVHPQRETRLRCNRCERPICSECAVLTPTGYRCRECVRSQQKVFETARTRDYILGAVVAFTLSFAAAMLCYLLGLFNSWFGFFVLLIAPFAGTLIAEGVRRVVGRRRSRLLFRLVAASALVGALPPLLVDLLPLFFSLTGGSLFPAALRILPIVWKVVYIISVTSAAYARISGIQLRR